MGDGVPAENAAWRACRRRGAVVVARGVAVGSDRRGYAIGEQGRLGPKTAADITSFSVGV